MIMLAYLDEVSELKKDRKFEASPGAILDCHTKDTYIELVNSGADEFVYMKETHV
jgi:hypothetical protein